MKSLIKAVAVALVLSAPVVSFAQSNEPVTRAQVRADLVQVEKAGYNPLDWMHYPENIQAAEARVAAQKGAAAETTGYGPSAIAASQSGQRGEVTMSSYSAPVYVGR